MHAPALLLKFVIAPLAVFGAASATAQQNNDDSQTQTITVAVGNETSTPAAGKNKPAGYLGVNCGSGAHSVQKDTTLNMSCSVTNGQAITLTYAVAGSSSSSSATINCGLEPPIWTDEAEATVTFTGSGASVTYTHSCTGVDD